MARATKLVKIINSNGRNTALSLDPSATLAVTRTVINRLEPGFMSPVDRFLFHGSTLPTNQESSVTLAQLIDKNDSITVGLETHVSPIDPKDGVQRYNLLQLAQKLALFQNMNIYRGLTMTTAAGFGRTFKNLYQWNAGALPAANNPDIDTEVESHMSFFKVTNDLAVHSVTKTSASLDTPYGGGSTEYEHARREETSTSKVTEWMMSKYTLRKVALKLDISDIEVDPEFTTAVQHAIAGREDDIQGYYSLLDTLNTWGYYIPLQFTLGGALYKQKSIQISDYKHAVSESDSFSASFKASFDGIGGGGAYSQAQGSEQTTTTSRKYEDEQFRLIGGSSNTLPTSPEAYNKWAESLKNAVDWDVVSYEELYPSIAVVSKTDMEVFNICTQLMDRFHTYPNAVELQPYLNMNDYSTKAMSIVMGDGGNPWAS